MSDGGRRLFERLVAAQNAHDIDAFVFCFAPDYTSEQPAHPDRAFVGSDQVRTNWTAMFAGVPDFRADLARDFTPAASSSARCVMEDSRRLACTCRMSNRLAEASRPRSIG